MNHHLSNNPLSHIKSHHYLLPALLILAVMVVILIFYGINRDNCYGIEESSARDNCYLLQLENTWNVSSCDKIENEDVKDLCYKKHRAEMKIMEAQKPDDRSIREKLLEKKQKQELRRQIEGEVPEFQPSQELIIGADGVIREKQ